MTDTTIHTGARGGQYRMSETGKKIYLKGEMNATKRQKEAFTRLQVQAQAVQLFLMAVKRYGSSDASRNASIDSLIYDALEEFVLNQPVINVYNPTMELFRRLLKIK